MFFLTLVVNYDLEGRLMHKTFIFQAPRTVADSKRKIGCVVTDRHIYITDAIIAENW